MIVLAARRVLLVGLRPGRYPRRGWVTSRVWFVERLGEIAHLESLAGTPWALRYARIMGHWVGDGARLGTLPPPTSLVTIGAGATLEADVDLHGWWIDGQELVIDEVSIGAGARVGTRSAADARRVDRRRRRDRAGTVVSGRMPAGQRWGGSPGRQIGQAGDGWPARGRPGRARASARRRCTRAGWRSRARCRCSRRVPGIVVLTRSLPGGWSAGARSRRCCRSLRPGAELRRQLCATRRGRGARDLAADQARLAPRGRDRWVGAMAHRVGDGPARGLLFPLYASLYTRPWLRLPGVKVGERTEISTGVGLNRLTSSASTASRPTTSRLDREGARRLDLPGADPRREPQLPRQQRDPPGRRRARQRQPRRRAHDRPATQHRRHLVVRLPGARAPRVADKPDPARTTHPPRRLIAARAAVEPVRILLPGTVSTALAALMFWALVAIGTAGVAAMVIAAPLLLGVAGLGATLVTVAVKWTLIGRYRPGEHPLWSLVRVAR